jgi:hypothetical protein
MKTFTMMGIMKMKILKWKKTESEVFLFSVCNGSYSEGVVLFKKRKPFPDPLLAAVLSARVCVCFILARSMGDRF